MALFVDVPININEYEEKIFANLTIRQLKWSAVALCVGTGTYYLTYSIFHFPQEISIYGTVAIAFCFFMCGWGKWEGRPITARFKAAIHYHRTKTIYFYRKDSIRYFRKEDANVIKKTRKDRKINGRECIENKRKAK